MVGTPIEQTTTYSYAFDNSVNLENQQSLYSITIKSDPNPPVTTYYDRAGQPIRAKKIGFNGKTIYKDSYYNSFGKLEKSTMPYFSDETPTFNTLYYDSYQRVIKEDTIAPNQQRAIDTISYDGYTTTTTNAKNQQKITTKNALDKTIYIKEPLGAEQHYHYDAVGNLVKTVDSHGNEIHLKYDIFGNKTQQNDPDMGVWHYSYNALGELTSQTDAKGQTTTMQYDLLGRKINETIGTETYDWQYDGQYIGKLDYTMKSVEREYLSQGKGNKVIKNGIADWNQDGKQYPLPISKYHMQNKKSFIYDTYGRVQSTTTTTDKEQFTTQYKYDTYSRIIQKTLPNDFMIKNTYNENGYLESIKSPVTQIKDFDPEHFVGLIEKTLKSSIEYYKKQLEYEEKVKELQAKARYYEQVAQRYHDSKEEYLAYAKTLRAYATRYQYYAERYKRYATYYQSVADRYMKYAQNLNNSWWGQWFKKHFEQIAKHYTWYATRYSYWSTYYLNRAKKNNYFADWIENHANTSIEEKRAYYLNLAKRAINEAKQAQSIAENYAQKAKDNQTINPHYQAILEDSEHNYFYKVLAHDAKGRVTTYLSGNGLITHHTYDEAGALNKMTTGYSFEEHQIRDLRFTYDTLANVTTREDNKLEVYQHYNYDNLNRLTQATTQTRSQETTMQYAYDAIGNMTLKSDIGDYTYDAQKPHQVIKAGSRTFTYDANGNMINNSGTTLTYTPFNKTKTITTPTDTITFSYDTQKQRSKKETNTQTTYYYNKSYERTYTNSEPNSIEEKYFIYAGGEVVSIYTNSRDKEGTLTPKTQYLHYDNLGSVDTITNNLGVVEQRMAYKPFGEKLSLDAQGNESHIPTKTNRGYTGHEHVEGTKFINMNARVYDPTIARFMSADTIIPAPYDTQAYNRYSYVKNNPLKYTDPSGHSWLSKVWKKVKKYIKTIITIAVVALVTIVTAGSALVAGMSAFGGVVFTGAVGGFAGGFTGTLLHGGSLGDAFKAGFKGAIVGAISAGMAYGVAEMTASLFNISPKAAHSASFFKTGGNFGAAAFKAVAHGVSRVMIVKAQGQNTSSAFWSGFASSALSVGTEGYGGVVGRTLIMATVGGTVSKLTGGKFSNGAVTGAFVHLFNAEGGTFSKIWNGLGKSMTKLNDRKYEILSDIGKGFKGGLKGYRDVRDNAPVGIRYWLRGTLTAAEVGATAGLSGVKYIGYEAISGAYFDTAPLSKYALGGYYTKTYLDKSFSTDPVTKKDINPYDY